jgi:hypothetical protein
METLCGKPPGQGHDAMKPDAVDKRLRGFLGMSDKFTRWKSDAFLALIMYHQLRTAFGWETYKKVFAEYRDLPNREACFRHLASNGQLQALAQQIKSRAVCTWTSSGFKWCALRRR